MPPSPGDKVRNVGLGFGIFEAETSTRESVGFAAVIFGTGADVAVAFGDDVVYIAMIQSGMVAGFSSDGIEGIKD